MAEFSGKAALITGAGRGIGAAAARELASRGCAVLLCARSAGAIEAVASEINAAGGVALAMRCDVADFASVEAAVARCVAEFGSIDILVNNAGTIEPIARLGETDPAEWGALIDVNLKGVYNGMRAALPRMAASGGGTIITISSGAATNPLEGWSAYCASKAGALMLTRAADKEYAEAGIVVTGLSPGTVATEMQRVIKRSGVNRVSDMEWEDHIPPEWPAKAIAFLCTDAGGKYAGQDFSLKTDENRTLLGLI